MAALLDFLRDFSFWTVTLRIVLATILGGIIGTERGKRGRAAGLRTHILVCLGAAMTAMTGFYVFNVLKVNFDPLRIAAQVISGIGFLGVGTILIKGQSHITGLTTAAGLWNTAAMGLALGVGFYEGAILCAIVSSGTISVFTNIEQKINGGKTAIVYIELKNAYEVNIILDAIKAHQFNAKNIAITHARSLIPNHLGIEAAFIIKKGTTVEEMLDRITSFEQVAYAVLSK